MGKPFKHFCNYPQTDLNGIVIHTDGEEQTEPGHTWGPGIRTYYLLHYVLSGSGWYHVGKEQHQLGAGDFFLSYPNEVIHYGSDSLNPWKYCWVGFSGLDIPGVLKYIDFTKKKHVIHMEDPQIAETMAALTGYSSMSIAGYFSTLAQLHQLISLLILHSEKSEPDAPHSIHLDHAVAYMENYFSNPEITIEIIAGYAGISSNHLYRLFMDAYSLSPIKYLTQLRIREACKLIRDNPASPISLIACSVGYDNPLYFSKVFKKVTGGSPSQYRTGSHYSEASKNITYPPTASP